MGIGIVFNKKIDIELAGEGVAPISIICPDSGRKPSIEINGTYDASDVINDFTVRITNFYISGLSSYTRIRVSAGYMNGRTLCAEGDISFSYIESPGPDRVTVLCCKIGDATAWTNRFINISFSNPVTIQELIQKISDSLGFGTPNIDTSLRSQTLPYFFHTGRASGALHYLTELLPKVNITTANNRISVWTPAKGDDRSAQANSRSFLLQNLTTPPAITGNTANVVAPWTPDVRPGDYVTFPTRTYSQDYAAAQAGTVGETCTIQVQTMNFRFATTEDANEMQLEGIIC